MSCENSDLSKEKVKLTEFNNFLGSEKAESLDLMVKSLDDFLDNSYSSKSSRQERFNALIQYLSKSSDYDSNWVFDTKLNGEILNLFEKSGMRSEMHLYSVENYDPLFFIDCDYLRERNDSIKELGSLILEIEDDTLAPIGGMDSLEQIEMENEIKLLEAKLKKRLDSTLWFNTRGQFLYGLSKFTGNDTLIVNYVKLRLEIGNFSPISFLEMNMDNGLKYENPFIKRIIVADIYYYMIKADIAKKQRNANKSYI